MWVKVKTKLDWGARKKGFDYNEADNKGERESSCFPAEGFIVFKSYLHLFGLQVMMKITYMFEILNLMCNDQLQCNISIGSKVYTI